MNSFQVGLGIVILVGLVIVWRKEIFAIIKRIKPAAGTTTPTTDNPTQSVTLRVVDDIVNVTLLRDRLEDEGCAEGVTACTDLLRVIVEHQNHPSAPTKGVA